jgi:ATP-binding cassette, subfamily C, bacterial CydD
MPDTVNKSILNALQGWKANAGLWLHLAVVIGVASGGLLILQAWLLARTVDAVVFDQAVLRQVMPWLWGLLALFTVRAGLAWASEQAGFQAAVRVKLALRETLYRQVQRLGPAWLSGERSGDIVNAISDGVEALEAYYARYLPAMSLMVFVPLAILVFVFSRDWLAGVVMVVTAPLIPLFMVLIGKGAEQRNQQQWRQLAWMSAHFLDVIQGLTTLRLFNASRREAQVIAGISDDYRRGSMSVLRIAFLSSFVLEFFSTVSIAVVAVLIGFRLYWGEMDFMHGLFVLLLVPEFYLPLRNMGTRYHARMEAIGAAERIVEILNTPVVEGSGNLTSVAELRQTDIRFEAVSFRYPDGRQAVQDIDLVVRPGETLALVGASGAGKTTLVNLLMGFLQPQGGRILVGGAPLQDIAPEAWRRQLAWLPQKPQLFPGSVADNIRLGMPRAGREAVHKAAALAQAGDFIEALPQGWDTRVGEAGQGLSGGQVQRLALARAFLKDAPLVILDEPTANLDLDSEARVHAAVRTLAAGRTLILIAHRLRTVREADRIVVLDNGRIVHTGTHAGLLQTSPLYRRMVTAYGGVP